MEVPSFLIWGFGGLGLLLAVFPVVTLLGSSINVAAANAQLIKLVQAGNVERAHKLCRAVPRAFYMAIADRMLPDSEEGGQAAAQRAESEFRIGYANMVARQKPLLLLAVAAAVAEVIALLMAVAGGQLEAPLAVIAVGLTASIIAIKAILGARSRIPVAAKQLIGVLRSSG